MAKKQVALVDLEDTAKTRSALTSLPTRNADATVDQRIAPENKTLPYLQQVAKNNPPKPLDVDSIELGPDQEFWQPKVDSKVDHSGEIHTQPANLGTQRIQEASAAEPNSALPSATGPRYKRVANPYENSTPGYGGTSMIANRAGEIVDLSGRSDIGTPGRSPAYPNGAVPGFNDQDLVDLYGGPAKSTMTDAEWKGQIAQNSAMPEGYVWDAKTGTAVNTALPKQVKNTWQTAGGKPIMVAGPDGKPRPMTQTGTDAELSFNAENHRSLPAIDLSGPGAMIQSALPYIAQNAAERRKAFEKQQQNQLFKDKWNIDLKQIEMGINAKKAASDAALNQAQIGRLNAETAAIPNKGSAAGGKLSLDQAKHMTELYQMSPDAFDAIAGIHDQPEETRAKLRPQKLREMLGYGGIQDAGAATARPSGAPPVQGAKQAGDGKWYVADPNRPGKYLMVNQ